MKRFSRAQFAIWSPVIYAWRALMFAFVLVARRDMAVARGFWRESAEEIRRRRA